VDTLVGPSADTYNGNDVAPLSAADIDRFVGHFAQAARNAREAGFDGVEIHGANGYLIDQFVQSVTNHRTDAYGGNLEGRMKFPLRVLDAVADAIGADRTGLRMSPFSTFQGMREPDPLATFVPYAQAVVKAQPALAYVHVVEPRVSGATDATDSVEGESAEPIRQVVDATDVKYIAAGGITPETAGEIIAAHGGLVALGRLYIANPDLLQRAVHGYELNPYDRSTFYTKGEKGYTE
jgi:NADPH2 dehydrogenase